MERRVEDLETIIEDVEANHSNLKVEVHHLHSEHTDRISPKLEVLELGIDHLTKIFKQLKEQEINDIF